MNIKKFYKTVRKLKEIKRSGWVERGIKDPESVADHSFMVAVLCLIYPKQDIDKVKAVKMALVHDLAESKTGDIITTAHWSQGGSMSREEKVKLERKAFKKLVEDLPEKESREIFNLWQELDEEKTPEAIFVRNIDAAEMIMQALDYYEKGNTKKPLELFWDERNMGLLKDEKMKEIIEDIIENGW